VADARLAVVAQPVLADDRRQPLGRARGQRRLGQPHGLQRDGAARRGQRAAELLFEPAERVGGRRGGVRVLAPPPPPHLARP
jgi:hypothetical protein